MGYQLRQGLSFAVVDGRFLFLDVDADRYFCLGQTAAAAFAAVLEAERSGRPSEAALASLLTSGLLVQQPLATGLSRCAPRTIGGTLLDHVHGRTSPLHAAEAWGRRVSAERRLGRGFARTIAFVRRRKLLAHGEADIGLAAQASAAFATAALVRTARSRCVSISVATMAWLGARRRTAHFVIGVRLNPFQAHCWIEVGGQLVNDELDAVRAFTPILAI